MARKLRKTNAEALFELPWIHSAMLGLFVLGLGQLILLLMPDTDLSRAFSPLITLILWLFAAPIFLISALSGSKKIIRWLMDSIRHNRAHKDSPEVDSGQERAVSHTTPPISSWRGFERLVAAAYRRDGFQVEETETPGPDGGIDLILRKGGKRQLVQCKYWHRDQVGVKIVRELFGVMTAERAHYAVIITTSSFTRDAKVFALGKPIYLMGARDTEQFLKGIDPAEFQVPMPDHESCPLCGEGVLVHRRATRGKHMGRLFVGCSEYPACEYTSSG